MHATWHGQHFGISLWWTVVILQQMAKLFYAPKHLVQGPSIPLSFNVMLLGLHVTLKGFVFLHPSALGERVLEIYTRV